MWRATVGVLTLILTFGLTTIGTSQDKKAKGQLPQGWKDIGLSLEQKGKVYEVQSEYKAKIVKLQQEIKGLQAQEKQDLLKILTPDQKTKLAKVLLGEGDTKKIDSKKDDKDKKE